MNKINFQRRTYRWTFNNRHFDGLSGRSVVVAGDNQAVVRVVEVLALADWLAYFRRRRLTSGSRDYSGCLK